MIKDIKVYKAKRKDEYKFQIKCHNVKSKRNGKSKDKIYIWRCYNEKQRDNWIEGLKKCCDNINNAVN